MSSSPSKPEHTLAGRTALICGASRGIGRATAMTFAQRGARCVVLARSAEQLRNLVATLPPPSRGDHSVLCADMTDTEGLAECLTRLQTSGHSIDIVINNTGGPAGGPLVEARPEALLAAFRQHVLATQVMVTTLVHGMRERRWGRFVNVLSTSVRVPIPGLGVSNTVRSAMAAHAKTLAGELAPFGITVNNILPGYTRTERMESLAGEAAARMGKSPVDIEAQWLAAVPMGRFADAAEIAEAIAFFASGAAGYITGQSLAVDGGRTGSI